MTIGEIIQRYGIEYIGRYYASYRGIVIDNKDPESRGRLLVSVPSVQDGIKVWAYPMDMPGGLKYGIKWITPRISEIVWVHFEMGNPMRPLWSYHGWATDEVPDELKDNDTVGLVTPNGNKIYLKEVDGELFIKVNQKVSIEVIDGSSITLDKEKVVVNGGSNKGVVNVDSLRELVKALQKDLLVAQSGSNIAKWMATGMEEIEDKTFEH